MSSQASLYKGMGRVRKRKRGRYATPTAKAEAYQRSITSGQVPRGVFPATRKVTHKYVGSGLISAGAGLGNAHVWSANSLYDPDVTGVGHQPYGRDEMVVIYGKYRVTEARIRVSFFNTSSCLASVRVDDLSTVITNGELALERPFVKWSPVGTTKQAQFVSKYRPEMFGIKDISEQEANAASAPARQVYFHCQASALDFTGALATTVITVEIEYDAIWSEPKHVVQS